ncbi:MAG: T9SS type A sorting domain-containing protein [Rufibacter sp.]
MALDNAGIYLAGWFSTNFASVFSIKFPTVGNNFLQIGCKGQNDAFVARFDYQTRKAKWVKAIGGNEHDYLYDLATNQGEVFATGYFDSSSDFNITGTLVNGAGTVATPMVKNAVGHRDFYLIKYEAESGNVAWAKTVGNAVDQFGTSVVADASGVYVAGGFSGQLDFNPEGSTPEIQTAQGENMDVFLVKYANVVAGVKEELMSDKFMRAYPNPTLDKLTVHISGGLPGGNYQVKVLNIVGQTVWQQPVKLSTNTQFTVPTHALPAGNYILVLENEISYVKQRFTKR